MPYRNSRMTPIKFMSSPAIFNAFCQVMEVIGTGRRAKMHVSSPFDHDTYS
jgi:hypothetical protein